MINDPSTPLESECTEAEHLVSWSFDQALGSKFGNKDRSLEGREAISREASRFDPDGTRTVRHQGNAAPPVNVVPSCLDIKGSTIDLSGTKLLVLNLSLPPGQRLAPNSEPMPTR